MLSHLWMMSGNVGVSMKKEREDADLEKGQEPEPRPAYGPAGEPDPEPEPEKVPPESVGDGLELDRMEVRSAEEMPEEG